MSDTRPDLTRAEIWRVADEFQSERDAAKRDAARMQDERDIALNRCAALTNELAEARRERDELAALLREALPFVDTNPDLHRPGGDELNERITRALAQETDGER